MGPVLLVAVLLGKVSYNKNVPFIKGDRKNRSDRSFFLVCLAHGFFDVKPRIHFLAWVEDILGVKDVFSISKKSEHFLAKHLAQVRRTDDTVVVLATNVTVEFYCGREEFVSHYFYHGWGGLVGEV